MTVVALTFLGSTALTTVVLRLTKAPEWMVAGFAMVLLAASAATAAFTPDARGFTIGAAATLAVFAAAIGGLGIPPLAFRLARRTAGDALVTSPQSLKGGLMIGILERTAIAAAIVAGWPEGIAIVLAVKGLARYPELRDPNVSEQFIIGTFASVLWAIACGGVARGMIG